MKRIAAGSLNRDQDSERFSPAVREANASVRDRSSVERNASSFSVVFVSAKVERRQSKVTSKAFILYPPLSAAMPAACPLGNWRRRSVRRQPYASSSSVARKTETGVNRPHRDDAPLVHQRRFRASERISD
ncbi:hypothetical protein EYF80_044354 [Liparis tanakae]|uniref:Uncharacterized protein n=1 Tax=Liparis tanakae TaxID=230148 RepID=A0A4Z2FW51_9TELE|nr:hypothetical protein EYF80_044354 [Liparis tanakae]